MTAQRAAGQGQVNNRKTARRERQVMARARVRGVAGKPPMAIATRVLGGRYQCGSRRFRPGHQLTFAAGSFAAFTWPHRVVSDPGAMRLTRVNDERAGLAPPRSVACPRHEPSEGGIYLGAGGRTGQPLTAKCPFPPTPLPKVGCDPPRPSAHHPAVVKRVELKRPTGRPGPLRRRGRFHRALHDTSPCRRI